MLFRQQAIEHKRKGLQGKVLLSNPISFSIITFMLAVVIIGAIVFLATGSFSRLAQARGIVTPAKGLVNIVAFGAGTISELIATEGELLAANQTVGRITSSSFSEYQGSQVEEQLNDIEAQLAQLDARIQQTNHLAGLRRVGTDQDILFATSELEFLQGSLDMQIALTDEMTASFERALDLSGRDLLSASALSLQRIELLRAQSGLQDLRARIAAAEIRLQRVETSKAQIIVDNELSLLSLEGERTAILSRANLLRASQGFDIVTAVQGHATGVLVENGYNVQPGDALFSIIPENSEFVVDLYVRGADIGFITEGQSVSMQYDSFPYQRYGSQNGTIAEITNSLILPTATSQATPTSEPSYRVTVELDRQTISAQGRDIPLQVGMSLTANIVLDELTIIEWLFQPLLSVVLR